MSSIVLSSAVRQNLLALQQTAAELATTQNDLSTGKKVNSALDNPTNYFTASGLDNRASDISNLLDGISNGVQVLQAANTGLTSLQSLVSQAKSIANQALQTSIGYSTKASITTSIGATATATNLFGTVDTAGTVTGSVILNQAATPVAVTVATKLSGASPSDSLPAAAIADGSTLTVNGQQITFHTGTGTNTESANGATIYTGNASSTVQTVLDSINAIAGAGTASLSAGAIVLSSGTSSAGITFGGTGSLLSSLGLGTVTSTGLGTSVTALNAAPTTIVGTTASTLNNLVLTIPATSSTATATSLTFGSGAGQISTLTGLNTALAANNLAATLDSNGNLQITTTNDAASSSIGTITAKIGGTAVTSGAFYQPTYIASPVADTASQNTRSNLVSQYNAILTQINNTATDASYNGVNLLNGDQLELTFDETGKSKLNITGVQDSAAGLGLSTLQSNAFVDNNATNTVLNNLNNVSTTLRSQASAFGSNLSVVQTRQDFNTNLINVLQTGSANLTQADINEEAANSQALSTRQSLSISALSLANQAQQSVLQLLR